MLTVDQQIEQYINSKQLAWSPNTLRSEKHRLISVRHLLTMPANQFYETASQYYQPYTLKTLMQRAAQFRSFLGDDSYANFMRTNALLFKNVYSKRAVGISFQEAKQRISSLADGPAKQACELMLTTGMRVHEALKYDGSGQVTGKGAKQRNVFTTKRVNGNTYYYEVYRALKSIGLKPHDLRKLAASQLAANGFKEADLMAVMGWSSIQTASTYLQPMLNLDMAAKLKAVLDE